MGVKHYDVIVIGGGPGGYTAALYCARSGRSVAVLEKLSAGGQMATTDRIDNYPGFEEGIDGFELGERMERQAWRFGVSTVYGEVRSVELAGRPKRIESTEGSFEAEAVILATGAFRGSWAFRTSRRSAGAGWLTAPPATACSTAARR